MHIVFIRHAKTSNYEENKRQAPDSRLGSLGKRQSRLLAKRIKRSGNLNNQKYHKIMSSSWERAKETAEIISKKLEIPVKEHRLLHEYLSNSILSNQPLDSEIVLEFKKAKKEKGIDFDWKFRGEGECMRDVINRAKKFKDELTTEHSGKNYFIVSHGLFITAFVTLVILGDDYEDKSFHDLSQMIFLENTSLTHLEYDETVKKWKIHCLNDASHIHQTNTK